MYILALEPVRLSHMFGSFRSREETTAVATTADSAAWGIELPPLPDLPDPLAEKLTEHTKMKGDSTATSVSPRKMNNEHYDYLIEALPRDFRFAKAVHGAASSPPWESIWSDKKNSSDLMENLLHVEIQKTFIEKLVSDLKMNITQMEKRSNKQLSRQDLTLLYQHTKSLFQTKAGIAKLSSTVIEMEIRAVTMMRNAVSRNLRVAKKRKYELLAVEQMLDLRRYRFDIGLLARSLRRDDLTFTLFAMLVGKLVLHAEYVKGDKAVNYLQMRIMSRDITQLVFETVSFLAEMQRDVVLDEYGDGSIIEELVAGEDMLVWQKNQEGESEAYAVSTNNQIGDIIVIDNE